MGCDFIEDRLIMWPGILALLLAVFSVAHFTPPKITTAKELAKYTNCEPENIRIWLRDYYDYDENFNADVGNTGDELTGDQCIARKGGGNCRCFAAISQDTLNECPGYAAHEGCMRMVDNETHCLTFFTTPDGSKGFINSGAQALEFPADTPWHTVEMSVQGNWVTP